jgi:Kef-type K+ transport system membrane component KefB
MAKEKRPIRPEIIVAGIFILVIILALIMDWWKTHAAVGWTLVGVVIVALGYSLFRYARFRNWVVKTAKSVVAKVAFQDKE